MTDDVKEPSLRRWTEPRGACASNMDCNRDVAASGRGIYGSARTYPPYSAGTWSGASQARRDTRPLRWLHRIVRVDFRPRDEAEEENKPTQSEGDYFGKESWIRVWQEWVRGGS